MNTDELNKWIDNSPYTEQEEVIVLLRQKQAEIEALKADVEKLKAAISEALESIPAVSDDGGLFFEHHDINGEYLGSEQIDPISVIQGMEEILTKAQEK